MPSIKPPAERIESVPIIDGGFVVAVPIPAAMKAYFEATRWRANLDGQIEYWHGCAVAALRSRNPKLQAIGTEGTCPAWIHPCAELFTLCVHTHSCH